MARVVCDALVSEPDFKQTSHESSTPAYGAVSSQAVADPRDGSREPTLWVMMLFGGCRTWLPSLPWYLAAGISFFAVGLIAFQFRRPRLRRFGFGKYLVYYLYLSAGLSIVAFAADALVSALFHR